jgi:lipopolysaccharide assembly outer membrane protein LptD (OstA)
MAEWAAREPFAIIWESVSPEQPGDRNNSSMKAGIDRFATLRSMLAEDNFQIIKPAPPNGETPQSGNAPTANNSNGISVNADSFSDSFNLPGIDVSEEEKTNNRMKGNGALNSTGKQQENTLHFNRRTRFWVEDEPVKKKKEEPGKLALEDGDGPYRVNIKADEIRNSGGVATASGHVEVEYRGVTLHADKITYNQYSRDINAEGNVAMQRGEDKMTGSSLMYNLMTQSANINNAYGYANNIAVGDVEMQKTIFFWGESVQWEQDRIYIKKGKVTSCDVPPPDYHYHITGDEIIIYPREKMIVRKARFFVGKSQWLGLPNTVFPLRQRDPRARQSLIPQIGRNQQEGEYLKESIGYLMGEKDYGTVHVDWYRKVGIGAGIEHFYHLGEKGAGKIYYYRMGSSSSSTNRYNFTDRTYYRFPGNYFMSFNYSTERYEFPEYSSPNIRNADFYLSKMTDNYMSALYIQDYIQGENRNYGANFYCRYTIDNRWQTQAVFDYLSSETAIQRQYRINTLGSLTYRGDIFDSYLVYDRTWGDRKFYVNREPELAARSHVFNIGPFDCRTSIAAGNFHEMPSDVIAARGDLKLSILNKVYPVTPSTNVAMAGGYRQLLYGTGEKKYVARGYLGLEQKFGKNFSLVGTYFVQDKNGFSPLAMDYFEKYNILGGTLEYFNQKNLRLQVNGGYDMEHKQYQSLIPRIEYAPSKEWKFILGSNYDMENRLWMNLDGEIGMKLAKQVTIKYWGLYDFVNQRLTYQNYVLELDSHDISTRLIYKGSQGELWLSVALKAFPYEKVEVGPDSNRNVVEKGLLQRAPDEEGL